MSNRNNRKGRKASGKKQAGKPGRKQPRKKIFEQLTGTVCMTREGYGFIRVPDREDDIFVPAKKLRGALNGDTVCVAVTQRKSASRRTEGEVIEITERSRKPFIGILQIIGSQAWVIVESRVMPYDISVPAEQVSPEQQGMKVACLVEDWPRGQDYPVGRIVDVLGEPGENNTEMHAILTEFGLPYRMSEQVEKAAAEIPVKIDKKEIAARRDFRDILTFTIDPADAKDFDDALSLRRLENGNWEVGVHIADVTHYVTPGSVIDDEAIQRGTSVYLVDRTVPMLPEALSNQLCSLRPQEDKLCFSAVFELTHDARLVQEWFGRTIIRSDRRFSYEQAQAILEEAGVCGDTPVQQPEKPEAGTNAAASAGETLSAPEDISGQPRKGRKKKGPSDEQVAEAVLELHRLAALLRKRRFAAGAISFERPEMKVIVDETGKPVDILQKISREANWLIEEFMLLANKEVATYITKKAGLKDPTFVYRIHDEPDPDKIQNLRDFIKHFGYSMGPARNAREIAVELNTLLDKTKGKPENNAIETIALRSMARAKYSTDNVGHYGLGFDYYTHFTSPIRRYPDMMVHRLLAHYLGNGKSPEKKKYEDLCKHASEREQLATEAERSSIKYKLVEFMQDKVGNQYDGTISGVTEWGLYVEIEPTKVEGMIMLRGIKEDYFIFDEKNYCVTGKSTGQRFMLGDKVKIKVLKANLEQKLLDYSLVWDESYNHARSRRRSKKQAEKALQAAAAAATPAVPESAAGEALPEKPGRAKTSRGRKSSGKPSGEPAGKSSGKTAGETAGTQPAPAAKPASGRRRKKDSAAG